MNKQAIIQILRTNHDSFIHYINNLSADDFLLSSALKWTAGQQLNHIVLCVAPIQQVLSMPKSKIAHLFKKEDKKSRSYEVILALYLEQLAEGGKAPGPYLPAAVPFENRANLCETLAVSVKSLCAQVETFTEEELDQLGMPHPLLKRLTIREMLYNVAYHVLHHMEQAKLNLKSEI